MKIFKSSLSPCTFVIWKQHALTIISSVILNFFNYSTTFYNTVSLNLLTGYKAVFTNLGASGRMGPTSLGSHYRGQEQDGQVTLVNGIQHWTVPYTGDYRIEAIGATGGYGTRTQPQYRGRGAKMIGSFRLSKGETIKILVGEQGTRNRGSQSSGGGGGTFVVRERNTPLIVAGGGGGTEVVVSRHIECDASTGTAGRAGYKSWAGGSGGHGAKIADNGNSGNDILHFEQASTPPIQVFSSIVSRNGPL